MRFALFGDHPDGLDMARALAESGRHELTVYCGPPLGIEILARAGLKPSRVGDAEEILADPSIDAVIVAGTAAHRAAQLRRALQSERHVLCVHPADRSPDIAYEAAMLRADAGCVLLPILPEALHPAVRRLAELARADEGDPRLLEFERWSTEDLAGDDIDGRGPSVPGWDVLRAVGGELGEVFAMTGVEEELVPGEPLVLAGRFVDGLLLQATYLPRQAEVRWRLSLVYRNSRATLDFPDGWPGRARLTYTDGAGQARTEDWPALSPWNAVMQAFEEALSGTAPAPALAWQDELRSLELDDAVRRSVERRRSSTLEYQEATEEASFKGTMTLVGCGLLWLCLGLLILSVWYPKLGWVIAPVIGVFLVLQLLRWALPAQSHKTPEGDLNRD
jgi:predicted dehydrogenase